MVSFGLRPVFGREQKKHWIGAQASGISKRKTSERWVVYLVTSSVKSKKQTLIYIAWTRCLVHCMDALLTPAGRKRCGPSGSSEQWDRGAVQKVALLTPAGRKRCSLFFDFWLHSKQDHHIQSCQHGQVKFKRFTRSWHFFFFPCLPKRKAIKVLNLVGTLASPCSDLYSVSLLKPLSHSTASLVKISRGHAEIKLETCWLCKWNIKMEFLKVPPPRSSCSRSAP